MPTQPVPHTHQHAASAVQWVRTRLGTTPVAPDQTGADASDRLLRAERALTEVEHELDQADSRPDAPV